MKIKPRYGYMCATHFLYHLGEDMHEVPIYATAKLLKEGRGCVRECGIYKVKISVSKVIKGGKF